MLKYLLVWPEPIKKTMCACKIMLSSNNAMKSNLFAIHWVCLTQIRRFRVSFLQTLHRQDLCNIMHMFLWKTSLTQPDYSWRLHLETTIQDSEWQWFSKYPESRKGLCWCPLLCRAHLKWRLFSVESLAALPDDNERSKNFGPSLSHQRTFTLNQQKNDE